MDCCEWALESAHCHCNSGCYTVWIRTIIDEENSCVQCGNNTSATMDYPWSYLVTTLNERSNHLRRPQIPPSQQTISRPCALSSSPPQIFPNCPLRTQSPLRASDRLFPPTISTPLPPSLHPTSPSLDFLPLSRNYFTRIGTYLLRI